MENQDFDLFKLIEEEEGETTPQQDTVTIPDIETPAPTGQSAQTGRGTPTGQVKQPDRKETGAENTTGETGEEKPTVGSMAKMLAMLVDMIQSRAFGIYSGNGFEKYKMNGAEKKEYEAAARVYLGTVDFELSPGLAFLLVNLMILGGNFSVAYQDKQEKGRAVKTKKETFLPEIKRENTPKKVSTTVNEKANEIKYFAAEFERKNGVKPSLRTIQENISFETSLSTIHKYLKK